MTRTCTNCGYVNSTADDTSVICPNCGVAYEVAPDVPPDLPGLATTHASPFTVPSGQYLTPPPAVTAMGVPTEQLTAPPRAPANRRNLLLGLLVAVVVVGALGGGAIALAAHRPAAVVVATPTAPPSPTPAKGMVVLYLDPHGQFTIKYPAGWTTQMGSLSLHGGSVDITRFVSKRGTDGLIVAVSQAPLAYGDAGALVGYYGGAGYKVDGSPTAIQAKSGQWQNVSATFTYKGQAAALFARSTQQSALNYLVIGFGPAPQFNGALLKALNAMFTSLATTSGA